MGAFPWCHRPWFSAPEKLLKATLLQVLPSVRSEQQLVEQIHQNLVFRWFVGPGIKDTVWNHKSNAAPVLPSQLGHALTESRRGLVVTVQGSVSDGTTERDVAAQMLADVAGPGKRVAAGTERAYHAKGLVKAYREIKVAPHVAQNTHRRGASVIDARTMRHAGYELRQRKRSRIEQCFDWGKVIGPICQMMVRGLDKVEQLLTLAMAAYNLTRLRALAQLRPQWAQ
jgi:hypothetical protein